MNTKIKERVYGLYTPHFSDMASISVRRLAWAMNKKMPATVDFMLRLIPSIIDPAKVCLACQDKTRCQSCTFRNPPTTEELAALLAGVFK